MSYTIVPNIIDYLDIYNISWFYCTIVFFTLTLVPTFIIYMYLNIIIWNFFEGE